MCLWEDVCASLAHVQQSKQFVSGGGHKLFELCELQSMNNSCMCVCARARACVRV